MTSEEKLEIAEMAYIKALGLVKQLLNFKRGSKSFSEEYSKTIWYFEASVQGVLLYASLEIGDLTATARDFIIGNTISGSIIDVANGIGPRRLYRSWVRLSWDNICSTGMPKDKLMEVIKEAVGTAVQNFVFPIAQVSYDISARDYSAEISANIKKIIHAVCSTDIPAGDVSSRADALEKILDAIDAGIKVFNDAFLVYWKGSTPLE